MISVKGLFDGKKINLLGKVDIKGPQDVIITFLGHDQDKVLHREIYELAETGGSFDFLDGAQEDIYSDDDLKVRYQND